MKYQRVCLFSLFLVLLLAATVTAQQPVKKRPVKNPPQFPNIIDTENKTPAQDKPEAAPAVMSVTAQQSELLVRAVESLAGEVRGLVQELRALNVRQQAQLDILRLTRSDFRVDLYERELKATRERITALEADEQNLQLIMKPENLAAQVQRIATFNRDETMRQLKESYDARLRNVTAEKELLQKREAELVVALEGYRVSAGDTEKRLKQAEEVLRQLEAPPSSTEQRREAPPENAKPAPPAERKP